MPEEEGGPKRRPKRGQERPPETMPEPRRLGPRPLPLHLLLASAGLTISPAALNGWRNVSPASNPPAPETAPQSESPPADRPPDPAEQRARLRAELEKAEPEALAAALAAEGRRRLDAFLTGVTLYRRHPVRRTLADPPVLWQAGTTRLLDYGGPSDSRGAASGPAVLVVPSLVNRGYILDLAEECSLMRYLAAQGLRPLLVDWGSPGAEERGFTLTGYVAGRLEPALDAARAAAGGPVAVIGYCMGGLLALALALRRAGDVSGLACLATPWDFHAVRPEQARLAGALVALLEPLLAAWRELPVDLIQALFALTDPFGVVRKFRDFAALDQSSAKARRFVLIEDWVNDGVPLAAPVARECLAGWYGANQPARGRWRIDGRPVRPEELRLPGLVVLPDRDRIVPPPSAAALARDLPAATVLRPAAGHIGMITGRAAEDRLWRPLAGWLAGLATGTRGRRSRSGLKSQPE